MLANQMKMLKLLKWVSKAKYCSLLICWQFSNWYICSRVWELNKMNANVLNRRLIRFSGTSFKMLIGDRYLSLSWMDREKIILRAQVFQNSPGFDFEHEKRCSFPSPIEIRSSTPLFSDAYLHLLVR